MVILVGLIGLMIGSFLNVLIARSSELESVIDTRSHCPHCKKDIAVYDLVPLLSFVLLQGKCRYCKKKISWQYPIVEGLTAGTAIHLFITFGLNPLSLCLFGIFCLLLVVTAVDMTSYGIPDIFVLPAIILAFILAFSKPVSQPFWGVLLSGGGIAFLSLASRERWMGTGDIGLGLIMGLLGGLTGAAIGLGVAFIAGALVGLLVVFLKRKRLKDMLPFGPFLALGTYVATFWGEPLTWYTRSFGAF